MAEKEKGMGERSKEIIYLKWACLRNKLRHKICK